MLIVKFAAAQKLYIIKDKEKIFLSPKSWIGITTKTDTVKYIGEKEMSFYIFHTSHDSITVRKPLTITDTAVLYYDGLYKTFDFDFQVKKYYKLKGQQFVTIGKITAFFYKSFAYADIISIQYPDKQFDEEGCAGCILVPGLNIWYLLNARSKTKHRNRDMQQWKFTVE
jgi:hypothetical protein